MAETQRPLRRLRARYLGWHNPPMWAAYFDQPGRMSCYCLASTIEALWLELEDYFAGRGYCAPQRVDARHLVESRNG